MHPSCSQQQGLARHVLFKDAGTAIVPTQGRPSCPGYPSERKERQRRTSKNCTKNEGMYILVPRYLSNKLPKRQVATERHFVRSTATSIHRAGTTEAHEPTSRPHSKFAPLLTLNPSPFINEQPMIINQQTNQPTKPSIHPSTRHHGRPPRNELAPRASTRLPRVSVRWHFSPKTRSLTSRLASIRRLEAFTHPQGVSRAKPSRVLDILSASCFAETIARSKRRVRHRHAFAREHRPCSMRSALAPRCCCSREESTTGEVTGHGTQPCQVH